MSSVEKAYNQWSEQYDTNENKTRDLEAAAIRECLSGIGFNSCLEIGCGTGKNTSWLQTKAQKITSVDLSGEMLKIAMTKVRPGKVNFIQADINDEWNFIKSKYDLVSFSLVLEHIENLDEVFRKASASLVTGGYVYMGELHPYKQYTGTKARFENDEGLNIVTCFNHNISDFTESAKKYGLNIFSFNEYFDDDSSTGIPRILAIVFQKN